MGGPRNEPARHAFLDCDVAPGMFAREFAVNVHTSDGDLVLFANVSDLTLTRAPAPGKPVKGQLRMHPIKNVGTRVLVDLPQPSVNRGSRVLVPKALLHAAMILSDAGE